jgi:acetoin utilization protein AcuC
VATAAGRPVDPAAETPEEWRAEVYRRTRQQAPLRMTDGAGPDWRDFHDGYDPADRLDQAVLAARRAVLPHHGLLP